MRCAVFGCTATEHSKRHKNDFFFPFPKDAIMCKAWKYACGRSEDFPADSAKICLLHFEKNDYERIIVPDTNCTAKICFELKSYALPTLNLPKLSKNVNHNVVFSNRGDCGDKAYKRNVDKIGENATIKRKKCAIIGCTSQRKNVFDFPDYQLHRSLYLKWVSLCNNDALKHLEPDELSKSFGICQTHLNENGMVIFQNPILNLPRKSLASGPIEAQTGDEIHEVSQLCRLCFGIGSVDLFSSKYYKKILKDIVTAFVPIEIRSDDVSKLICENCKCEVIRFYNFLIKSLQVDEFFQAINEEANNENEDGDPSDAISEASLITISDDAEENLKIEEDTVIEEEPSLLRRRLTSPSASLAIKSEPVPDENPVKEENMEESYSNHVPSYVMKHIHNYNKTSNTKVKREASESPKRSIESDDMTVICIHCNQSVESIDAFHEHCRLENHEPIFTCPDCNRMFKSQADLNAHSDSHGRHQSTVCDQCGKQFTKRENLYNHLNTVHNKSGLKYDCKVCSKKFSTNYRLKLHSRVHTNEKPYCCEQCGAVFTLPSNLKNHQADHSGYKPHVCLICKKGFNRKSKLAMHLTKHTGECFSCDKCGLSYKCHANLKRHDQKYHPDPNEIIDSTQRKCPQCDFVCNFARQLRVHMLKEHKSYTCGTCNMSFNNYQPYYNHKFKHYPNRKKYKCKHCDKRFINATLLNVHMVVHTGKKNFECHICEKKFSQRPHLQSHFLIHTGEKPHKCRYCSKSFAHLSTLVVHERIHTGETPYMCQFCNKGYGHLTNYKKHMFSQHGVIIPKQRDYSSIVRAGEQSEVEKDENSAVEVIEMPLSVVIDDQDQQNDGEEVVGDPEDAIVVMEYS